MTCVTCKYSLEDTGRMDRGKTRAICTVCHTTYRVLPATDTFGNLITDAEGEVEIYLEPILINNTSKQFNNFPFAFVCSAKVKEDYIELIKEINRCKSVNDFLNYLKD